MFWTCKRWEKTREAWRPRVEELAAAVVGLGGPCCRSWLICTRMVAMVPKGLGMQCDPVGAATVQAFTAALLSQYVTILMERGLERRMGLPVGQAARGSTGGITHSASYLDDC